MKPLELVIWQDITSNTNEWFDDISNLNTYTFYTAGWVLLEDDNVIKMVSTHSDPKEDDITYGHDTIIPKGCVIDRIVLKKRWSKK